MQIGNAYRQIKHGYMDACLAGGFDIVLGTPGQKVMDSYGLNFNKAVLNNDCNDDPLRSLRPFDVDRRGTVLADGGSVLVVESLDSALKRGAKIYCEIVGY